MERDEDFMLQRELLARPRALARPSGPEQEEAAFGRREQARVSRGSNHGVILP
jgi:hypothetical protein